MHLLAMAVTIEGLAMVVVLVVGVVVGEGEGEGEVCMRECTVVVSV